MQSQKYWVHNPLLNFAVRTKVDQISSVNAPAKYSTTHYLADTVVPTMPNIS